MDIRLSKLHSSQLFCHRVFLSTALLESASGHDWRFEDFALLLLFVLSRFATACFTALGPSSWFRRWRLCQIEIRVRSMLGYLPLGISDDLSIDGIVELLLLLVQLLLLLWLLLWLLMRRLLFGRQFRQFKLVIRIYIDFLDRLLKCFSSNSVSLLSCLHCFELLLDSNIFRLSKSVCLLNSLVIELREVCVEPVIVGKVLIVIRFLNLLGSLPLVWLREDLVVWHPHSNKHEEPFCVRLPFLHQSDSSLVHDQFSWLLFSFRLQTKDELLNLSDEELLRRPTVAFRNITCVSFRRDEEIFFFSFAHELHGADPWAKLWHHVVELAHCLVEMRAWANHLRNIRFRNFNHLQKVSLIIIIRMVRRQPQAAIP